jgi:hypothetical protein
LIIAAIAIVAEGGLRKGGRRTLRPLKQLGHIFDEGIYV